MTLQRAVIDYRTKFWEHGQLYVGLSRVKRPDDLRILLPPDTDDFTIRPPVDRSVVQIIETMNHSSASPITPHLAVPDASPDFSSPDCPDRISSDGRPCPNEYFDSPEEQLDLGPSFHDDAAERIDSQPLEIPRNVSVISSILDEWQVLQFNCLGIDRGKPSLAVAVVLRRVLETCYAKFSLVMKSDSCSHPKNLFMSSLLETRILLSRFLVLY
jgi:hypothetical protein